MNKIALLLDFDGTIDERNIATLLLDKFAIGDWKRYMSMSSKGEMSFRESVEREFACLPSQRDKLTAFVLREAKVRGGLHRLVDCCARRNFPAAVVSGGLDFYIQPILDKHGLGHIPCYCGAADFESGDRLKVVFDGVVPSCDAAGTCKCFQVWRYQEQGYKVALVGDGTSDMCASAQADYVFARRRLLEHCQEQGLSHFPFETFDDVLNVLKGLADGS